MSEQSYVETIVGPIASADLGRTLVHEHIFVKTSEIEATRFDRYWDEDAEVAKAIEGLTALKAAGIDTLVDCTVPGLGRDIDAVARLASEATVNIVVATGLYAIGALPFYFALRGPNEPFGGPDPIDALLKRELEHGIGDTGIKPAFIKVALETDDPHSPLARPLAAAARVHAEFGTPIQVHTNCATHNGRTAIEILRSYDVDLTRVVLGHAGDSNDLDYLAELLDSGAYVGLDRFGLDAYNTTGRRVDTLVELLNRGHERQLVLSHDADSFNDAAPFPRDQAARKRRSPDHRWDFIPTMVLPMLHAAGVSEASLHALLVDNPREFFVGR